jgi:L-arabinose isomerase
MDKVLLRRAVLVGSLMFGSAIAVAQEMPKESVLPLSLAQRATQAAIDACKKDGYRVSASVVDRAGLLRARWDGLMEPVRILSIAVGKRPTPL